MCRNVYYNIIYKQWQAFIIIACVHNWHYRMTFPVTRSKVIYNCAKNSNLMTRLMKPLFWLVNQTMTRWRHPITGLDILEEGVRPAWFQRNRIVCQDWATVVTTFKGREATLYLRSVGDLLSLWPLLQQNWNSYI